MSMIWSQSSSGKSSVGARLVMPAQLIRMSTLPNWFRTSSQQSFERSSIVHVRGAAQCFTAFGFDFSGRLVHLFRPSRRGDHIRAGVRQPQRKSMANAGGAADNHGGFPCKSKMEALMFLSEDVVARLTVDTVSATLSLYPRQKGRREEMAAEKILRIDPKDNVLVALTPLPAGEAVTFSGEQYIPLSDIPAKQKFAMRDLAVGDEVIMYGGIVGLVRQAIPRGGLLSTRNVQHDASGFGPKVGNYSWSAPDVSPWSSRTFDGYHRADGQVGTRNYWLVIPLVFCENRNVEALRDAFEEELGYGRPKLYRQQVRQLIAQHHQGARATERGDLTSGRPEQVFPNVDGVRFLVHEGGCGGTRQDSKALCGLLAGYIHHPNVAGATVLSLGCQNAQPSILMDALRQRDPALHKPVLMFEQQQSGLESDMLSEAIRATFEGLVEANRLTRKPAPLSKLTVALKCGGSDGFSGISANPALGHVSDMLAALGAKSILSEFPELCGMEQSLINRCVDASQADRFIQLMRDYAARAKAVHSGFEMNPFPGKYQGRIDHRRHEVRRRGQEGRHIPRLRGA